jgi:PKD repeat protein
MKKTILFLGILVSVSCAKDPIADFTFTDNQIEMSDVIFTNNSQNAKSYLWDFGDGSTSTEESPIHAFQSEGTYLVTLTAKGKKDDISVSKNITILGVTADFTFTNDQMTGDDVVFTNTSENAESYSWDFGDGSTSTEVSPTHAYSLGGTFTVTLTASYGAAEDEISKDIHILADQTTYSVKNSSSYLLEQVASYYWNGSDSEEYTDHGDMDPGDETTPAVTEKPERDVFFYFLSTYACISYYPYPMTQNAHNRMIIDDYTELFCVSKKSADGLRDMPNDLELERARSLKTGMTNLSILSAK